MSFLKRFHSRRWCVLAHRGYYIVVVPLKKQRTGKFFKPWDNPDEMNLEEVGVVVMAAVYPA